MNDFDNSLKTVEHVFPKSIGGTITISEVCKACNDHLGSFVDSPLINNFFIDAMRYFLKLPDKAGNIPDPLKNPFLSTDPNQKVHIKIDNENKRSIYLPTKKKSFIDSDGKKHIYIKVDKSDEDTLPIIMEKIRRRASRDGIEVKLEGHPKEYFRCEETIVNQTINFNGLNWKRGILKIAYELTYRKIGTLYLSTPIAYNIRELLKLKEISENDFQKYPIKGIFSLVTNTELFPSLSNSDSLYAALLSINNELRCFVRIFNVFQCFLLVNGQYSGNSTLNGTVIQIDASKKTTREIPYYESFI
jgi:hypothetical protein